MPATDILFDLKNIKDFFGKFFLIINEISTPEGHKMLILIFLHWSNHFTPRVIILGGNNIYEL
jgi:hypothetical protein